MATGAMKTWPSIRIITEGVLDANAGLRRGSGYEQAKAKLRCIESDEVAVAFGPPA